MKKKLLLIIFIVSGIILSAVEHPVELQNKIDEAYRITSELKQNNQIWINENKDTREYNVGDTDTFWKWDLSIMPPQNVEESATCRAVGEHCYIFVSDAEWNVHMNQDDIDVIYPYLEETTMSGLDYGAVEMDIITFGPVPDVHDNDPKLIVYYSELQSYGGTAFDGYFNAFNQLTDQQAQSYGEHSNECEMIYMNCHPLDPAAPIRISVLSHELEHLIHWGMDVNEDTWVDEGCAEYAMHIFGLPDPITSFPGNSNNNLTVWDQNWSDYIKTYLFFTYLAENYGGSDIISAVVAESQNSINGVQSALVTQGFQEPFESVFTNWTNANFLKDYLTLDLPTFTPAAWHNTFPANGSFSVEGWAARYIKIGNGENDLNITFSSDGIYNVNILFYNDNGNTGMENFVMAAGNGEVFVPAFDDEFDYIGINVTNITNGEQNFSYTITEEINEDNIELWTYNFLNNTNTLISATRQINSTLCNVYVDDEIWNITIDAEDVEYIRNAFEDSTASDPTKGIYELDTEMFGQTSDIDNNNKTNILIYDIDDEDINGYFSPSDLLGGSYSNNMELLYIDDNPHGSGINSSYCYATLAHELQHLIHANYDSNESTWVNEGLAGFAQWVNGWISPYWMMLFIQNPDNNLVQWNAGADYPQSYLFMQYLYEHYAFGENNIIPNLVQSTENSTNGLDAALMETGWGDDVTSIDVFNNWVIANHINDPVFMEGFYSYSDNPIGTGQFVLTNTDEHANYPISVTDVSMNHWSVNYVLFEDTGSDFQVSFDGNDTSSDFHVQFVTFYNDEPDQLVHMELDAEMNGTTVLTGLDNKVLMIVTDTYTSYSQITYSYDATDAVSSEDDEINILSQYSVTNYPNPFNLQSSDRSTGMTISYNIPLNGNVQIDIFNIKGQKVTSLQNEFVNSGENSVNWDGRDNTNSVVSSGIYYYRITSGQFTEMKKIMLLK